MNAQVCPHPTCDRVAADALHQDPFGQRWCPAHARWCQLLNAASLLDWPAVELGGRLTAGSAPWAWRVPELTGPQVDAALSRTWGTTAMGETAVGYAREQPEQRQAAAAPVSSRLSAFAPKQRA